MFMLRIPAAFAWLLTSVVALGATRSSPDLGRSPASPIGDSSSRPRVLEAASFRHFIDAFNEDDQELYPESIPNKNAWDFLKDNLPLFDSPDQDINEIYYFRWWTYRKHVKETPEGFIITEFLPPVGWAGKYNSINCAAGHHLHEGRWLADGRYFG